MPIRSEDRPTYAQAVWSVFCRKSGVDRVISPAEYALLDGWMNEGIPLPVLFRGFDEFKGKPSRLTALERPVRRAYEYWFQAMGGL